NEPLNEPLSDMLREIKQNPYITKDELGKKLGRSRATITRQIQKLKEMLMVKRVGSDKSGHWEVV
ncbi:MAG: HTH domain-containing protein, partial [Spirochaetes bacterium]|nr:HTH domain-containing protein [Spirochaetota bacterium]